MEKGPLMMMKKALPLFAFLIFLPVLSHAGSDRVGIIDAGLMVSYDVFSDGGINNNAYLGGSVSYGINSWFAIGVSAGWHDSSFDVPDSAAGSTAKGGRVAMVPIFADFIFRVPGSETKNVVPYGVMGLGGIITNLHGTGDASRFNQTVNDEGGFAFKLGAGVDWFATQNWIYNLETGYVFMSADIKVGSTNTDLDYYYIGGGVKWIG